MGGFWAPPRDDMRSRQASNKQKQRVEKALPRKKEHRIEVLETLLREEYTGAGTGRSILVDGLPVDPKDQRALAAILANLKETLRECGAAHTADSLSAMSTILAAACRPAMRDEKMQRAVSRVLEVKHDHIYAAVAAHLAGGEIKRT